MTSHGEMISPHWEDMEIERETERSWNILEMKTENKALYHGAKHVRHHAVTWTENHRANSRGYPDWDDVYYTVSIPGCAHGAQNLYEGCCAVCEHQMEVNNRM